MCVGLSADVSVSVTEDEIDVMSADDTTALQAFTARFLCRLFDVKLTHIGTICLDPAFMWDPPGTSIKLCQRC